MSKEEGEVTGEVVHQGARGATFAGMIGALLLLGTVVVTLWLQDAQYGQEPTQDEWGAAAAYLRGELGEGDVVRVAPLWSDEARLFLDGVAVDLLPEPDPDVLDYYRRVWVLAGFGRGEEARSQLAPLGYQEGPSESFGGVEVLRFEIPEGRTPRFDILDAFPDAQVNRVYSDRAEDCDRWDGRKQTWFCPDNNAFINASRRFTVVAEQPRECIYLSAPEYHGWLEVTYDAVLESTLRGVVGLDRDAARKGRGGDVEFEILIDGERAYTKRLIKKQIVVHGYEIDTKSRSGQEVKLTYRMRAESVLDRFVCFTGVTR